MQYYADREEKKSYKPPAGVQAEARRALEWIKSGDAAVTWTNGILATEGKKANGKESNKKEKNTDYDHMIKHRSGDPKNKELYSRIKSEAKEKFDVYPSAVANAWVVKEYKKRGGKYGKETKKESSRLWYEAD